MHNKTDYQLGQIRVINQLEKQIQKGSQNFSTVDPVSDYVNDKRICLTSVHFPSSKLITEIKNQIIKPLKSIDSNHFYYPDTSLHLTIKNIRIISNPPNFSEADINAAKEVFENTICSHYRFRVYFYKLLMFKDSLSLIGTTDDELDNIILDLDSKLKNFGILDDKRYINKNHFFCNMTLVRFSTKPSENFHTKVKKLFNNTNMNPYWIDSVSLVSTNATLTKRTKHGTWKLKS